MRSFNGGYGYPPFGALQQTEAGTPSLADLFASTASSDRSAGLDLELQRILAHQVHQQQAQQAQQQAQQQQRSDMTSLLLLQLQGQGQGHGSYAPHTQLPLSLAGAGSSDHHHHHLEAAALLKQQEDQLMISRAMAQQRQLDDFLISRPPVSQVGGLGGVGPHESVLAAQHQLSLVGRSTQPTSALLSGLDSSLLQGQLLPRMNAVTATAFGAKQPRSDLMDMNSMMESSKVRMEEVDNGHDAPIKSLDVAKEPKEEQEEDEEEDDNNEDAAGQEEDPNSDTFPHKLYRMIAEAEEGGNDNIVCFFSHGKAFAIHKPHDFVREIMPKYFTTSRMSSFQRQLNLYGFRRITEGQDKGGYFHDSFLQGRKNLIKKIKRKKTTVRAPPNFFAQSFLPNSGLGGGAAAAAGQHQLSSRQILAGGVGSHNFQDAVLAAAAAGGGGGRDVNQALLLLVQQQHMQQQQQSGLMQELLMRQQQDPQSLLLLERERSRRQGQDPYR